MTRIVIKATAGDRVETDARRLGLRADMSRVDIEAWIDDEVTNLKAAKAILKVLALEVAALKSRMRRRERRHP